MGDKIYKNLLEYYNEYGPFYISKAPKIKIDWFKIYPSNFPHSAQKNTGRLPARLR